VRGAVAGDDPLSRRRLQVGAELSRETFVAATEAFHGAARIRLPLYERAGAGDACTMHKPIVTSRGFEVAAADLGQFAVVTETTR
jgi:hypothetical protein